MPLALIYLHLREARRETALAAARAVAVAHPKDPAATHKEFVRDAER